MAVTHQAVTWKNREQQGKGNAQSVSVALLYCHTQCQMKYTHGEDVLKKFLRDTLVSHTCTKLYLFNSKGVFSFVNDAENQKHADENTLLENR